MRRGVYSRVGERERDPVTGRIVATPKVVCGRKFCTGCGKWRLLLDFQPLTTRDSVRAQCGACHRADARERYAKRTPEQIELRREYDRIYQDAQRRAMGVPYRNFHNRRSVVDRIERVFLDPAPLLIMMARLGISDGELGELSRRAGISQRAIYRWRYGEARSIRLDLADRLAFALGTHMALIYGDAEPVNRAAA